MSSLRCNIRGGNRRGIFSQIVLNFGNRNWFKLLTNSHGKYKIFMEVQRLKIKMIERNIESIVRTMRFLIGEASTTTAVIIRVVLLVMLALLAVEAVRNQWAWYYLTGIVTYTVSMIVLWNYLNKQSN